MGILGVWLTAGFALPFVNVLDMFSPEQLMVFRGFITALIAFVTLRGSIGGVDKFTLLISLVLPFATLGLFQGIRHWGAGPTIVIVAGTPLINLLIGKFLGRKISLTSVIGLVMILVGVAIAQKGGEFQWTGFLWSVFGTIMNAVLYELFARSKDSSMQKCFYSCIGMGVLGLALSIRSEAVWSLVVDPEIAGLVFGFAFVGGFLYWIANLTAFKYLPTTEASALAQGETPAVILGAFILLGETMEIHQWIGVFITLYGAWHLSRLLAENNKHEEEIQSVKTSKG